MDPMILAACALSGAAVAVASVAGRSGYELALDFVQRDLTEKLRRLRLPYQNLRRYLYLWTALTLICFAVVFVGVENAWFAVLLVVAMICLPWFLLRRASQRYKEKIEDQLADGMVTFSSSIRAGLSIAQSLELLADQGPRPMRDEFRQVVGEYKMGKPLERTLQEAKDRLQSENFAMFAAALLASRESGGKLNETVERIAQSVLEMQRLDRKVRSETAQARRSAMYMALAPLFILVAYYFLEPENTIRLFNTLPGQMILSLAIVLNVTAYFWARRILHPDI